MNGKYSGGLLLFITLALFLNACSDSNVDINSQDTNANAELLENIPDDAVASIDEKIFNEEDLQFYTLIEKIEIESNRYFDLLESEGDSVDRNAFWDEQLAHLENVNVQLNQMLELYAMRLLAEEKHFDIAYEKVKAAIDDFHEQTAEIETVQELINEFERDVFNRKMREYMKTSLMRDRVVSDLEYTVRQDNPEATEDEINLILSKKYEDLFMDHVGDLEIRVYLE